MKGECYIDVAVGDVAPINKCLLVVNTLGSLHLLGLDWRDKFGLSRLRLSMVKENVNTVCSEPVKYIQNKINPIAVKYTKVFKEEFGRDTKLKVLLF